MISFIEIKETFFNKQNIQFELPDGNTIYLEWDTKNAGINLLFNKKVFWLYTPNVVTVNDVVVPDITLRTFIELLGYKYNTITVSFDYSDCNILDKLIYSLPVCSVIIHPIHYIQEYSYFESGFIPLLSH